MTTTPRPNDIKKLYRCFIRYAGAAVLHAHPARINLRLLYRPEFDIWMKKVKHGDDKSIIEDHLEWEEFARRVNNTLAMLYHSSHYNGTLPDKVFSNLASMKYQMDPPAKIEARYPGKYNLNTLRTSRLDFLTPKKAKKQSNQEKMFAWDAFAETVGMAEGSADVLLGKTRPRPIVRYTNENQAQNNDKNQDHP